MVVTSVTIAHPYSPKKARESEEESEAKCHRLGNLCIICVPKISEWVSGADSDGLTNEMDVL